MILIFGGVRSGKSKFAMEAAKKGCRSVCYVATAPVCDEEMRQRVLRHRKARPAAWSTLEVQKGLALRLGAIPKKCGGVIIECVGTYVANLMMAGANEAAIIKDIAAAIKILKTMKKKVFIVSNEVGSGVVPDSELGRRFRDIVGVLNQLIAKEADRVYMISAGLPVRLK